MQWSHKWFKFYKILHLLIYDMHKSKKILAFSITIGVVILFALQYIFKNKIIKAIETELPPNIVLNYSQLNTNILMGTIELDSLSFNITHSDKKEFIEINAPRLKIVGIHLWQFIISKSISIKEIIFENPDVHYYQTQKSKGNAEATTSKKQFNKSTDRSIRGRSP